MGQEPQGNGGVHEMCLFMYPYRTVTYNALIWLLFLCPILSHLICHDFATLLPRQRAFRILPFLQSSGPKSQTLSIPFVLRC